MPKVKYLTRDKSGAKLRRKVPQELCELAGKTAWVERVSGSGKELRELANLFAVRTDAEIKTLRNRIALTQTNASADQAIATGFKVRLTKTDAKQLASLYFQKRKEERLLARTYSTGVGDAESIADAAADYSDALRAAAGEDLPDLPSASSHGEQVALRLLVDASFIDGRAVERQSAGGRRGRERFIVPEWLRDNRNFQTLCRLIEEIDVELARQRLEYLQTGNAPTIQNELFFVAPPEWLSAEGKAVENFHSLGDLASAFEKLKTDEGVSASRQSQYRIVLRSLREELGDD